MPEAIEHSTVELSAPETRNNREALARAFDLANVPMAPGCYLMKDAKGQIIYVGKAKNLRARLRSYINESDERYTVRFIMKRVTRIDFLVTNNDKEALLLENSLIKQNKPRYNVRLKDDKTYLSLRLDPREDFPRITTVRRYRKDGAKYFGPYHSAGSMRQMLRQLQRLFPLRTCSDHVLHNRTRPCLYYEMKRCAGPCVGHVDREAYGEIVNQTILALDGRNADLENILTAKIKAHADALEFEEAALLRDRLFAIQRTLERQRTVGMPGTADQDVVGLFSEGRFTEIQVLFFRSGKMIGGRDFSFERTEMPPEELLSSFLLQFYSEAPVIPAEVLIPLPLEDADALSELLTEQRGSVVNVHWPQRGEKVALVDLAARNARAGFQEKRLTEKSQMDTLEQVQQTLQLTRVPRRIECFDISTIQGNKTVGSMVTFTDGRPDKGRYRRFSIKTVEGQDDFASMREMLLRRYTRAIEEDDLPDLTLIDGGKGQLNVAVAVFKDLAIEDVPLASIAKSRPTDSGPTAERFFLPGRMNPVIPPQSGPVVQLLAQVRDEAHRFAITYHRTKRKAGTLRTSLTSIPGVGPKRARALLNKLGSVARIREASVEEIAAVPGFDAKLAQMVYEHLRAPGGA